MTDSGGTGLLDRLLPPPADHANLEDGLPDRDGQQADRQGEARSWLTEHGLPAPRDEWWKYTDLKALTDRPWIPAARPPQPTPTRADIDRLAGVQTGPRLVFVDGTFVAELSDLEAGSDGTSLTVQSTTAGGRLDGADTARAAGWYLWGYDGFQALNDIAGQDGAHVHLAAGTQLDDPISIVQIGTGSADLPFASHPRATVELESDSQATIVETYIGFDGPHLANARTVIHVGERAKLTHYKILRGHPETSHVAHTRISLAADADVRSWAVLAGAAVARNTLDVNLHAPGATVDLEGLYLPVGRQRYDTAITVDHAASHGTSRQRYRGVIGDSAHGAFSGRVIVEADTSGNDASQVNRCLLLSPNAVADSRPWLEIFADDVACTHGAAVGRLDAEALFYLRTRGIPIAEARRLLIAGFVDELVSSIESPLVRAVATDVVNSTTTQAGPLR